jgi:O-methyltransferase domain/Dimerisation domain
MTMSSTLPQQAGRSSRGSACSTDAAPSGTEPTEEEHTAAAAVLGMIWGMHVSRALYAVTELGIPDRLASGPVSCAELATGAGAHEASLYRVLRLLTALGLFNETLPRSFSLTILGDRLRSGAPASMRSWALLHGTVGGCQPFEHILHTVRTGQPGFDAAHGMPLFEFLAQHLGDAAVFDAAMLERTAAFAPSVAAGYDFSDIRTVVDVGGGRGTLLAAILRSHRHLQGTLFEMPFVAAGAEAVLAAADVMDRCQVVTGDFFHGVPAGADCYLLANVLHDWDDTKAAQILASCRNAATRHGRVLIIERLIPDDPAEAVPVLLSDINMLVLTSGGRERTNSEYGKLLQAAGLSQGIIQPVTFPYGVIEGLLD